MLTLVAQFGEHLQHEFLVASSQKVENLTKVKIVGLDLLIDKAIKHYKKQMKRKPKDIIIYRLGLSDA